eukprot:gene22391-28994_t
MATTKKFIIRISSGLEFKFQKLDENAVSMLKDQCPSGDFLYLESLSEDRHRYHYRPSAVKSNFWLFSSTNPFVDDKNKAPEPGRYQLILSSNRDELFEYGLCGSTLEALKSNKTLSYLFGAEAQTQQIVVTDESSPIKYRVDLVFNNLIISLDFSNFHKDRLLSAQPPVDVNHGGKSNGTISGQISNLSSALPYETWTKIISLSQAETVLVTGRSWSGSIAHAAALMLRECLKQCNLDLPVKAVSFDGPLCGSALLLTSIDRSNCKSDHITICNSEDIISRLLCDFQKLSPLMKDGNVADQKSFMFAVFNSSIKQYQNGWRETIDLNNVAQAETNLLNSVGITTDNQLHPVGRFLFRHEDGEFTDESDTEGVTARLKQLIGRRNNVYESAYTYQHVLQYRPTAPIPRRQLPPELISLRPKLTSFNMIQTKHRVTMNFEGEYLDTLKCRLADRELEIKATQLGSLPFNIRSGTFEPKDHAKIVSLAPSSGKVVIEVIGCNFGREGEVSLYTDLGETNPVRFNSTNVVDGEESAPSKSIHPTMNAEFLSAAALRIALYCRSKGDVLQCLGNNQRLSLLWSLLLSLEKLLCTEQVLEKYLNQFLKGEVDIATMRNMCVGVFADISRKTVQDFVPKENILLRVGRKILGIFGMAGGGALLAATFFLLIPPALLFLPLASYHADAIDGNYSSLGRFGLGVHFTFSGVLALPSAIIGSIGYFLFDAAQYAMRDQESLMYKRILKELLQSLGGSHFAVVDELCPLEDRVVQLYKERFPTSEELYKCTPKDIMNVINEDLRAKFPMDGGDSSEACNSSKKLKQSFDKQPILLDKLILVGHIHTIRMILEYNILIGFAGVHNAGKSTTVNKLFGFETNASLLVRTEEPTLYELGSWVESHSRSSHSRFREWLADGKKDSLQICAVDFPGTTDERLGVALITRYTAEVASIFVIILKAGHIAGPEMEVVKVAKDNHKPFLVVINYCDTIRHELKTESSRERIKETYAKVLGVPENMLCFMSALTPRDIDGLRCVIYNMVQNILGDSLVSRSLSLHFITDQTMETILRSNKETDLSVLDNPDGLCEATSSLLFNSLPITGDRIIGRLRQHSKLVLQDAEKGIDRTMAKKSGIMEDLMQLACLLDIDNDVFEIVSDTFLFHLKKREDLMGLHSPHKSLTFVTKYLSAEALSDLNQKLQGYFTGRYQTVNADVGMDEQSQRRIGTDVLLAFHSLFNIWKERGNEPCVVKMAFKSLLYTDHLQFNDSNMLQCIHEAKSVYDLGSQKADQDHQQERSVPERSLMMLTTPTSKKPPSRRLDPDDIEVSVLDSAADIEYNRYNESKRRMDTLKQWAFKTSSAMRHNNQGQGTIEEFQNLHRQNSARFTRIHMIHVIKEHLLDSVIEGLLGLTEDELETADIRFNLIDDPSIDAHGVTRAVLTKVAEYINANPSEVMLSRDSDSGFLYFDPQYCYAGNKKDAQR